MLLLSLTIYGGIAQKAIAADQPVAISSAPPLVVPPLETPPLVTPPLVTPPSNSPTSTNRPLTTAPTPSTTAQKSGVSVHDKDCHDDGDLSGNKHCHFKKRDKDDKDDATSNVVPTTPTFNPGAETGSFNPGGETDTFNPSGATPNNIAPPITNPSTPAVTPTTTATPGAATSKAK